MIVLTGMCYSGKTTIGKNLSQKINKPFYDFADLFFKEFSKTEMEYLEEYGKERFGEAERLVLSKASGDIILSLSGSCIYYDEEMLKLKDKIIFLNPTLDNIKRRKSIENKERPILYPDGINSFEELYQQRVPLYHKYASKIIDVKDEDTIEDVTKMVLVNIKEW